MEGAAMKKLQWDLIFLAVFTITALSGGRAEALYHYVSDCTVCHYGGGAESSACTACANNALIKCVIDIPGGGSSNTTFGPYVTREDPYNGVCEVCHGDTKYHQNKPDGNHDHYFEQPCVSCHKHSYEFSHGGDSCGDMGCHDGSSGPHATHVTSNSRGPATPMACNDCHSGTSPLAIGQPVLFADEKPLDTTGACNDCHSQGGAYDGLKNDANGSIGAKDHWHWVDAGGNECEGVYEVIPDWKESTAYQAYDLVKYEGTVYQRDNDGTSGGSFNVTDWTGVGPFADAWYGRWHRGTEYKTGDVVEYDGDVYRSLADVTSGAAFNALNWELIGPPYVSRYAWQSYHSYLLSEEVRYDHNAYRAIDSFVSVDVFNPDNWELIGPQYDSRFIKWKPSKTYYPNDVVQCNFGRSYRCVAVGEFVSGENFDDSKWRRIWGNETLVPTKEKWCAGCHDGGTSVVGSMAAPSVIGDGSTYGHYVSGHGRPSPNLTCEVCHDATIRHIVSFNGRQRTYGALAVKPAKFYQNGYRLNSQMVIPRPDTQVDDDTFKPCTNCHDYSQLVSTQSNFRDGSLFVHHEIHLESIINCWDSDWNADPLDPDNYKETQAGGPIDSHLSCPACHNVHGSPAPAMTRHGELISTPGTVPKDKVPALAFKWLDVSLSETHVLDQSRYGWLKAGPAESGPMKNHICTNCHREDAEYTQDGSGERYQRCPKGEEGIMVLKVWTSHSVPDANGDYDKTLFYPEDGIYYNARFQVSGCGYPDGTPYVVKSSDSKAKCRMPDAGCYEGDEGFWQTDLTRTDNLAAGTYVWTWDDTLPADPVLGDDSAKLVMRLEFYHSGGVDIPELTHFFTIVEPPPE